MQNQTNNFSEFSLLSRLFGNLYYRDPNDAVLANVFTWLQQGGLQNAWALEEDKATKDALASLQMKIDSKALSEEYHYLFDADGKVGTEISSIINLDELKAFREERAMPELERIDHVAGLLLTAAWIEDNLDSTQAQTQFFQYFLLPVSAKWLPLIEQHARLPFYRQLAYLTRELLSAMADELEETE